MTVFLWVLLAHLLYDFHWQGPFIAENKGRYLFLLCVHVATWALLVSGVLSVLGTLTWWHMPFLAVTHFASDYWKSHQPRTPETFWYIYVDQGVHLVSLIAVCL